MQVHGTDLIVVGEENRGEGALPGSARVEGDALITTEIRLPLAAYSADCMLIYFASKEKPLAALAHAGWRGTLGGIGAKVARYLQVHYGADPGQLVAALSPAVCRECYEIDGKTAELFRAGGWDNPAYLEPSAAGSFKLDLGAVNREQLTGAGIRKENIRWSGLCTSCREDLFYSYRRDRGVTGRMIGFIAIREQQGGRTS